MKENKLKTPLCPACGCSLVRLGISIENAVKTIYQGKEYLFCCEGCLQVFARNPEALLAETGSLVICPVCLAEKPKSHTVEVDYQGFKLYFCKCPHCKTVFWKDPEYYIKRLTGDVEFSGLFTEGQVSSFSCF